MYYLLYLIKTLIIISAAVISKSVFKETKLKMISLQIEKLVYLVHYWLDKILKGGLEIRALSALFYFCRIYVPTSVNFIYCRHGYFDPMNIETSKPIKQTLFTTPIITYS